MFVYQFDDVVRFLHLVWHRLTRSRFPHIPHPHLDSDHHVGTTLSIAAMPMVLWYLLSSGRTIGGSLLVMAAVLLSFVLFSVAMEFFVVRMKAHGHISAYAAMVIALISASQPILRAVPWQAQRARKSLSKLAFLLSVPVVAGILLKAYYGRHSSDDDFSRYMDILIVVMVAGMFINIVTNELRRYVRRHNVGILGLFRVAAGVAITVFLFH